VSAELVVQLIGWGANLAHKSPDGSTALIKAASGGHPNHETLAGQQAIHIAAGASDWGLVLRLLECGQIDPNALPKDDQNLPLLHTAVQQSAEEAVSMLLAEKADVSLHAGREKLQPLDVAAMTGMCPLHGCYWRQRPRRRWEPAPRSW